MTTYQGSATQLPAINPTQPPAINLTRLTSRNLRNKESSKRSRGGNRWVWVFVGLAVIITIVVVVVNFSKSKPTGPTGATGATGPTGATKTDPKPPKKELKMGITGLDRWGGDVKNHPNVEFEACKKICMDKEDCIGLSYHKDSKNCYVKGYPDISTNIMRNPSPLHGWQWYYRTDKPYANVDMATGWYNTGSGGTHVSALGAGFEWNKDMTWEKCAAKAKELKYAAFGMRNSKNGEHPNTCFFEKNAFNPYTGGIKLEVHDSNAMACTNPKKTITSGCRFDQAADSTKVIPGYNLGPHENREPWSENMGTIEDCRVFAKKHGFKGYGHRTDIHPDEHWKNKCYYFTEGHIKAVPDWKGNIDDYAHVQGCVDPSKAWPNC